MKLLSYGPEPYASANSAISARQILFAFTKLSIKQALYKVLGDLYGLYTTESTF